MHLNGETRNTTYDWSYWLQELDAHNKLSVEAKCREWLQSVPTPNDIHLETYSCKMPSTHLSGVYKSDSFSSSKKPLNKLTMNSKHTNTYPQEKQQQHKKAMVIKQQKLSPTPYNPSIYTGNALPSKDLSKGGLHEARKSQLNKSKLIEPANLQKVPLIPGLHNKSKVYDSMKKSVQPPQIYKVQRAPKQQKVLHQIPNTNTENKQRKKSVVVNFSKTSHVKMESTSSMQTLKTAKQSLERPKPPIFSEQFNHFIVQKSQISKTKSPYLQKVSKVVQTVKNTKTPPIHLKLKQTNPFVLPALNERIKSPYIANSNNRRVSNTTKLEKQPKEYESARNIHSKTTKPHMLTKQSNEEKLRIKDSKVPKKAPIVQKTTIHRAEHQAAPNLPNREKQQLYRGNLDLSQTNLKREIALKDDSSKLLRGQKSRFKPSTSYNTNSLRNVGLGKEIMSVAKEPLPNIKKSDISKKIEQIFNMNKRLKETRDGISGFKTDLNTTANTLSSLQRKQWALMDKINSVRKQSPLFKNTK